MHWHIACSHYAKNANNATRISSTLHPVSQSSTSDLQKGEIYIELVWVFRFLLFSHSLIKHLLSNYAYQTIVLITIDLNNNNFFSTNICPRAVGFKRSEFLYHSATCKTFLSLLRRDSPQRFQDDRPGRIAKSGNLQRQMVASLPAPRLRLFEQTSRAVAYSCTPLTRHWISAVGLVSVCTRKRLKSQKLLNS